ncbi:MAG TPA: hypothetical protein VKT25_08875 [Ktedonobacteraceae bacterium]|nr:hypothetical protein [Ktedonobacteraceae bacterium]
MDPTNNDAEMVERHLLSQCQPVYAYRHYSVDGKEPLSPPFTDENGEG